MIHRIELTEAEARNAIAVGEFGAPVIRSSRNVAVLLTQGWCSEWRAMDRWLEKLIQSGEPTDVEINLYRLVYDRVSYFEEFLAFKESTFGNYAVPYVRYYVDGVLVGESNYCSAARFLAPFAP